MGIQIVWPQPGYEKLRRWPRYKIDVPVRLIADKTAKVVSSRGEEITTTKTVIVQGRGRELGCGGMAVFAGIELALGEQVAVEFTPPYSGQPIRVRGLIRNRNGYTYGIEFIRDTGSDHENVAQLESILKTFGSMVN